jgi:hypothetical protein
VIKRAATFFVIVAAALVLLVTVAVRAQPSLQAAVLEVPENPAPHPAPAQPLPFSHSTHGVTGLQCEICHTNPDPGSQMTFPATSTCMICHGTVATDSPAIIKLAEFARSSQPVPWVRVYQVMPGVTWTHRAHLQAGMRCVMCHGDVTQYDAMAEITSVRAMASCISCHDAHRASNTCRTCHAWPAD